MKRGFWVKYFGFFVIIYLIVFGGLMVFRNKNFSDKKLEYLIESPNENISLTNDPCDFYVGGNPTEPDKKNIKLLFICSDGREARNMLGWAGIENKTVGGVIEEVAKVNRIDIEILRTWKCDVDGKVVENWNEKIVNDSLIKCKP